MKLHYMSKFNGDMESLPKKEHEPGAVQYEEPDDMNKLAKLANGIAVALFFVTLPILIIRGGGLVFNIWACIVVVLSLYPHELLHAICFKEDVYFYTAWKLGILFVTGTENMSRERFIFMSMLPNLVFGFIPFILFLINPSWTFFGTLGAFAIPSGAGDYMNVYNTIRQVPKGAKVYMNGMHTYWFLPANDV